MTTPRQLEANQKNALKSTGPKTPAGKAKVARNAVTHGLTAATLAVLPDEDGQAYEAFCAHIHGELNPVGELETSLTATIAGCLWRLARAAGILSWAYYARLLQQARQKVAQHKDALPDSLTTISDTEAHQAAVQEVVKLESTQQEQVPLCGQAFVHDSVGADGMRKLAWYETRLFNNLQKALRLLNERQANRVDPSG